MIAMAEPAIRAPQSRKSSAICAPGCMPFLFAQMVMNSTIFHSTAAPAWRKAISNGPWRRSKEREYGLNQQLEATGSYIPTSSLMYNNSCYSYCRNGSIPPPTCTVHRRRTRGSTKWSRRHTPKCEGPTANHGENTAWTTAQPAYLKVPPSFRS